MKKNLINISHYKMAEEDDLDIAMFLRHKMIQVDEINEKIRAVNLVLDLEIDEISIKIDLPLTSDEDVLDIFYSDKRFNEIERTLNLIINTVRYKDFDFYDLHEPASIYLDELMNDQIYYECHVELIELTSEENLYDSLISRLKGEEVEGLYR